MATKSYTLTPLLNRTLTAHFYGPDELEVTVEQQAPHPYDPKRRQEAEEKQIAKLHKIKRERDNRSVSVSLKRLKDAAADEKVNLFPSVIEAVKEYATVGEICDVLREIFGEYHEYGVI